MRPSIILSRTKDGWKATHLDENAQPCAELIKQFGTNIVPTAFSATVNPNTMALVIGDLNPDSDIIVIE